jgi:hypothetical protein
MKVLRLTFLLLIGAFLFIQPAQAIITSTHVEATTIEQRTTELKKEFKAEKKMSKFEKFKKAFDFKDPVRKWLWLGLVLWIASAVMWAIPGIWYLGGLVSLAGTVCIVVWLIKEFG